MYAGQACSRDAIFETDFINLTTVGGVAYTKIDFSGCNEHQSYCFYEES